MSEANHPDLTVFNRHLEGKTDLIDGFAHFRSRVDDFDLDLLLEEVDSSDYSAIDWAEALVEFDGWLESHKVSERPFTQMVGYVHCCTLMNAPQISLPSLKVIVYQSLTDFGFKAISETQF